MITDEELETVLERLAQARKLACKNGETTIWRDRADTMETRMRPSVGGAVVRVDERNLRHLLNDQTEPVTERSIEQLLCDICSQPRKYPRVVVA
jgi:hypothetical protein